jgi:ribosomal protein L37AE/L43A
MKIEEKDDKVLIDDFEIDGHIDEKRCCSNCKFNLVYYEDFDAYFCPNCNYSNVVTLIANTVLTVLKNHYLTNRVLNYHENKFLQD